VTTLLPLPSSQQNHKERRRSPFPYNKAIEEGDGSCRLLLLQYKVDVVVTFFSLLQKKKGAGSHLLRYAAVQQKKMKKATAATMLSPSLLCNAAQ